MALYTVPDVLTDPYLRPGNRLVAEVELPRYGGGSVLDAVKAKLLGAGIASHTPDDARKTDRYGSIDLVEIRGGRRESNVGDAVGLQRPRVELSLQLNTGSHYGGFMARMRNALAAVQDMAGETA